ncbi:hypothetical protein Taro_041950 [Colocasia esculenta]|uniref:Uncharacterized protein n=1 Tax=Colocasia esculenta TaxID=4460 RepID=A0A843WV31_COLES|nr:hypothetical protein [Colocasia esculenta]
MLNIKEMLLLLLPLVNSSSIKKFLLPFSKDKSSSSSDDDSICPICQLNPTIPFVALPCQHRLGFCGARAPGQSDAVPGALFTYLAGSVITVLGQGVQQLLHTVVQDATSLSLPCNAKHQLASRNANKRKQE